MGAKEKDKSLLEIAIELLQKKRKPQKILAIVSEVMELKGYKPQQAKDAAAQFILDFMQSGNFVYCGDDCWDLKERQSTAVLDKDGGDYEEIFYDDEDVKKNELKDDIFTKDFISPNPNDEESEDDETEEEEEDDDIARELGTFSDEDDTEDSEEDDEIDRELSEIEVLSDDESEEEEDDLTEEDFK